MEKPVFVGGRRCVNWNLSTSSHEKAGPPNGVGPPPLNSLSHDPKQFGLHSLRIGGATAMAAGGQIPDRVVEREGRWKRKSGSAKKYTRNLEDASAVSSKFAEG